MKQRATLYVGLALVLAVAVALLVWKPWDRASGISSPEASNEHTVESPNRQAGDAGDVVVERVTETKRNVSKEERERYRQAIRDAPARRERERPADVPTPPDLPHPNDSAEAPDAPDEGGGGLTDRSDGQLAGLMQSFQEDVMPLADECYSLARDTEPELAGGLDLEFEIVGDEDVGGMVDAVDLLDSSEIQNEQLIECMRETLFSTIFPAPDDSGSTEVKLTLEFSPDEP